MKGEEPIVFSLHSFLCDLGGGRGGLVDVIAFCCFFSRYSVIFYLDWIHAKKNAIYGLGMNDLDLVSNILLLLKTQSGCTLKHNHPKKDDFWRLVTQPNPPLNPCMRVTNARQLFIRL